MLIFKGATVKNLNIQLFTHSFGDLPLPTSKDTTHGIEKGSRESFGEDHIVTKLAEALPWSLLKDMPLDMIDLPKRVMEVVKDF